MDAFFGPNLTSGTDPPRLQCPTHPPPTDSASQGQEEQGWGRSEGFLAGLEIVLGLGRPEKPSLSGS